jgi:retinol-binding protein 3
MHMMRKVRAGIAMLMCLVWVPALHADTKSETISAAISAVERQQLVAALADALRGRYVFPQVAKTTADALRSDMRKRVFDQCKTGPDLAAALTQRLREITQDKHLGVSYSAEPLESDRPSELTPAQIQERQTLRRQRIQARNFSIARVERLKHNVGYINIVGFEPAEEAGEAIASAMRLVAYTDALIIDLRENGGGYPSGVAQLESYFFNGRTHLNDMYIRDGNLIEETWTLDELAGPRYGEKRPVYLLTSRNTFSGGEDMAYTIQQLKRVTIVGEITGGGANPGSDVRLNDHFSAFIPFARAINPITKDNWEGSGVQPDVETSADNALKAAHVLALKAISALETDASKVNDIQALIAELESAL